MHRRNSAVSVPFSSPTPYPEPTPLSSKDVADSIPPDSSSITLNPFHGSESMMTLETTDPKAIRPPSSSTGELSVSTATHSRSDQSQPLVLSSTHSPITEISDDDKINKVSSGTPKDILDRLRGFSLFASAPESFLEAIAGKLVPQMHSANTFIITQGEEARAMYWIIRGSVGIVSRDGEAVHAVLGPGAFFGEIGILFDCPRTASVQAREKCLLAVLTAGALNEVLPSYPVIERAIRDEAQERLAVLEKNQLAKQANIQESSRRKNSVITQDPLSNNQVSISESPITPNFRPRNHSIGDLSTYLEHTGIREMLAEMPLFNQLSSAVLHRLALGIEPKAYDPFQMIIRQNTPGKDIYFIIDGQVEVLDEVSQTVIARLTRGAYFGEMAFLSLADKRTASVRTITEVNCLVITEQTLDSLCEDFPDIQSHIEETAKHRIGKNQSQQIWQQDPQGPNAPIASSTYLKRHSSISTSSSEHSTSTREDSDSKDVPQRKLLDLDPFHIKKSTEDTHDTHDKDEHGVGLFSKSWNTAGSFDSPSASMVLEPPVHDLAPHELDHTQNLDPTSLNRADSSPADLAGYSFNSHSSSTESSLPASPHSSSESNHLLISDPATTVSNSMNFKVSTNDPKFNTPPHYYSSPSPASSPSHNNNKSISMMFSGFESIPEEDETGGGVILGSDPPTSDSRTQVPSTTVVAGVRRRVSHGLLLHPRVKRVRQSGRRRSSLFNVGPFPDFIQIKIFQYLDLKSLMAMQRVCQHWHQILQTSQQLVRELDLRQYNTTINDKSIISITNFAGLRPKVVDISNCFHLTDEGFSFLVNGIGLAKIHVFRMKSVWEVSGMAIMDLTVPSIGSDLKEIDLSNCRKVGDSTLSRLIGWIVPAYGPDGQPTVSPPPGTVVGCAKLKRISLSYCKHITDRSMYHMAMFASDRIESIDLTRCTTITDHGFSFWTLRSFSALRHLCLADCTFLTDKAIIAIASAAKGLQSLVLSFCCALTDVSVEVLALGCPALETLDLAFCGSAVSDMSLSTVALHLLELKSLSVRGCVRVTTSGVDTILMVAGSHKLKFLDISQCRNVQGHVQGPVDVNTGLARVTIKQ